MALRPALLSMLRSAVLIGGLIIIADLATQLFMQRSSGPESVEELNAANTVINVVLFSVLGAMVARQTGLFYLSGIAGLLASLLDAAVVILAWTMAPLPGGNPPIGDYLLSNVLLGIIPAAISGVVSNLVERTTSSGGPRSK